MEKQKMGKKHLYKLRKKTDFEIFIKFQVIGKGKYQIYYIFMLSLNRKKCKF